MSDFKLVTSSVLYSNHDKKTALSSNLINVEPTLPAVFFSLKKLFTFGDARIGVRHEMRIFHQMTPIDLSSTGAH